MSDRPLRIVTAVAAYDGHDASVLALNRALLAGSRSVEVIYLGFNMSSESIATAALQENADAVAISSYNGGHLQFFPHLMGRLAEMGMGGILVFGGEGVRSTPMMQGYWRKRGWKRSTDLAGPLTPLPRI